MCGVSPVVSMTFRRNRAAQLSKLRRLEGVQGLLVVPEPDSLALVGESQAWRLPVWPWWRQGDGTSSLRSASKLAPSI